MTATEKLVEFVTNLTEDQVYKLLNSPRMVAVMAEFRKEKSA